MNLEEKCTVLEDFSRQFTTGEIYREFFEDFVIYNDLGIPLSQTVVYNLATLTEEGTKVVEETWDQLCELLDLDPNMEYQDFNEMLDIFESEIEDEE